MKKPTKLNANELIESSYVDCSDERKKLFNSLIGEINKAIEIGYIGQDEKTYQAQYAPIFFDDFLESETNSVTIDCDIIDDKGEIIGTSRSYCEWNGTKWVWEE